MNNETKFEDLWDKYSQHVDDNLDSFQQVAGQSLITRSDFFKLITESHSNEMPKSTDEFLRHLIDTTWNECTESSEVPSTEWAIKIIEKAVSTFKIKEGERSK